MAETMSRPAERVPDEREVRLRRLLARFHLLRFEISDFDAATSIYRRCRKVGVTPVAWSTA